MALTKTITIDGCRQFVYNTNLVVIEQNATLTIDDAYITVDSITGSKEELQVGVKIAGGSVEPMQFYKFIPSVMEGSDNFIKQAYEYLKTLPEFANSIDC
jgi:hypothetical protein